MEFSNSMELSKQPSNGYLPSIWDAETICSINLPYTYESHGARLEEMKQAAKCLFISENEPKQKLDLIDTLQRLGVAKYLTNEIKEFLHHVNPKIADDLYTVALQFRLLRENGFSVDAEVFKKFMDNDGKFEKRLEKDVEGLLRLYEASYLGIYGEHIMDEANRFSTIHLKWVLDTLDEDLAERVRESLDFPLYWRMPRMEARNFVDVYQREPKNSSDLLELAMLDFNLLQSLYLDELKELARWWKDLNLKEKLPFARDKMVECYFWAMGTVPEPHLRKCRMNITKFGSIVTVIDDVYDTYASLDELDLYTNAVIRWDVKVMEELPEYMKVCCLAMYEHVNELACEASKVLGVDVLPYIKDQWQSYMRAMHVDAGWAHGGTMPTLDEYLQNGWVSVGIPTSLAYAFLGLLVDSKTKNFPLQFFQHWSDSELYYLPSIIIRLVDDLHISKNEMDRGEIVNSIKCYMIEEGVCEETARAHIKRLIEDSMKKFNKFIAQNSLPDGYANAALMMIRCVHRMYQFGDWFDAQNKENKDCVISSFFIPVKI